MKRMIIALAITMIALPLAQANDSDHETDSDGLATADLVLRELSDILKERDAETVGEWTIMDVRGLIADVSVRMQEVAYVQKTRTASWLWPGAGHFMNDDKGRGAFYTSANVALMAGTLVGAYFLLPNELRFDELNYFDDRYAVIEQTWKSQSFNDLFPSLGVIIGGVAARMILGHFAAESAGTLAAENINNGTVTFEPYGAADGFGLTATWRR